MPSAFVALAAESKSAAKAEAVMVITSALRKLFRKLRTQLFFLRFAVFLQTLHFHAQLLLQRFQFVVATARLRLADLVFQKQFFLRDLSLVTGIDFRELLLLLAR